MAARLRALSSQVSRQEQHMSAKSTEWNETRAQAMIGKRVLVGITLVTEQGKVVRQMFGTIACVDRHGIEIALEGAHAGKTARLPPDLGSFHFAGPGEFLLRETGEILVEPDFVSTWTIHETAACDGRDVIRWNS
jgi:hypothetical protein